MYLLGGIVLYRLFLFPTPPKKKEKSGTYLNPTLSHEAQQITSFPPTSTTHARTSSPSPASPASSTPLAPTHWFYLPHGLVSKAYIGELQITRDAAVDNCNDNVAPTVLQTRELGFCFGALIDGDAVE